MPISPLRVPLSVSIVSCDVVGHSRKHGFEAQIGQLESLNAVVRHAIRDLGDDKVLWCSRGDGGHVILPGDGQGINAIRMIKDFAGWSEVQAVALRIVAHKGDVMLFEGADGRMELAGDDINLVGLLMKDIRAREIVATEAFYDSLDTQCRGLVRSETEFLLQARYLPRIKLKLLHIEPFKSFGRYRHQNLDSEYLADPNCAAADMPGT